MKVGKLLLISPPAFTFRSPRDVNPLPPMGLGYLASVAEKMNIEVKILDCLVHGWNHEEFVNDELVRVGLSDRDIEIFISDFNPDMVGINCQFSRQFRIYHQMFSTIKKVNPHIITIAGGPHTSVCPEEVLSDPNCDFIMIGEAEESFGEFMVSMNTGNDITSIDGLGWKTNGGLNINLKRKLIASLDSIPFPAYHLMELEKYFGLTTSHGPRHKNRFAPVITSRGCPSKCTFCSAHKVWGDKYRIRSVDNVIEEMKLLKNRYGIEELMFEDDNITANPRRAKELFSRMIEEKFNFVWDTPNGVGVWSIDEEMIDLMKKSGCVKLNFPVESGSQHVLDTIIRKPIKLSRVSKLISYCRKIDLDVGIFLVVGMPGEKIEDIWQSFRFAAECGVFGPLVSVATPYPGTKLFDECMEKHYFSREFTLDGLFTKSFLIQTPDWNEHDLRKTIFRGYLYLKLNEAVKHPGQFFLWVIRKIKHPSRIMGHLRRIIGKKTSQ